MFFKKFSESLYRFFLIFGLTRQETYVVGLLIVLAVIGATIPYLRPFFSDPKPAENIEAKSTAFRIYSDRILNDSALTQDERDSLMTLINVDSVSILRWQRQADSLKKLLTARPARESVDSFFTQLQDAPVKQVDINDATAAELSSLPGIGEKIAERIIEYRNKNGNFRRIEELQNVKGIGKKMFAKIKPFVEIK